MTIRISPWLVDMFIMLLAVGVAAIGATLLDGWEVAVTWAVAYLTGYFIAKRRAAREVRAALR